MAVANSRLILGDVTALNVLDGRPIRNANVMYEIGMAHAVRLPEEVLLLRSDEYELDFDLANVRVNFYRPGASIEDARSLIQELITAALAEINLKRHVAVERAMGSLDVIDMAILFDAISSGEGIKHSAPDADTGSIANIARSRAISHLISLGALQSEIREAQPEYFMNLIEEF